VRGGKECERHHFDPKWVPIHSDLFELGKRYVRHLQKFADVPKNQLRILNMAASTTSGFLIPATAPVASAPRVSSARRRRISPQAGRALEILGHAIEYLTDEFVHSGGNFNARNEQLEAVQLLMAMNRQVYFECPEVPTLGERFRGMLKLHAN
jgi:hypothetical protein